MQQARGSPKGNGPPQEGTPVTASISNGPWTGWNEGSHTLLAREVTMPITKTPLVLSPGWMKPKPRVTLSYPSPKGLCESIKICSKYGIHTHFRGNRIIKNILVSPKDKDPIENKSGAIYLLQCGKLACG